MTNSDRDLSKQQKGIDFKLFPQIRVRVWGMAWRKTATDCSSCGMTIQGPSYWTDREVL